MRYINVRKTLLSPQADSSDDRSRSPVPEETSPDLLKENGVAEDASQASRSSSLRGTAGTKNKATPITPDKKISSQAEQAAQDRRFNSRDESSVKVPKTLSELSPEQRQKYELVRKAQRAKHREGEATNAARPVQDDPETLSPETDEQHESSKIRIQSPRSDSSKLTPELRTKYLEERARRENQELQGLEGAKATKADPTNISGKIRRFEDLAPDERKRYERANRQRSSEGIRRGNADSVVDSKRKIPRIEDLTPKEREKYLLARTKRKEAEKAALKPGQSSGLSVDEKEEIRNA